MGPEQRYQLVALLALIGQDLCTGKMSTQVFVTDKSAQRAVAPIHQDKAFAGDELVSSSPRGSVENA